MANQPAGKAPSDSPALKPYRGKPAVRNFREGNGNVGIIRSPVRAIALRDKRTSGQPRPRTEEIRPKFRIVRNTLTIAQEARFYERNGEQPLKWIDAAEPLFLFHCSLAYSAFTRGSIGISGPASLHRVDKSW